MFQTVLHILCVVGCVLCFLSLIPNIIFNKNNIFKVINSTIYTVSFGSFLLIFELLKKYLENFYGLFFDYHYIILISTILISIVGILLVISGSFVKNVRFNKFGYIIYEFLALALNVALVINLFTSKVSSYSVVLLPIILLNIIFTEQFVINYTENLKTTFSKYLYFIFNSVVSFFWIVSVFTLIFKNSFVINGAFVLLTIVSLILSSSSIIFGILRLSKEKKND